MDIDVNLCPMGKIKSLYTGEELKIASNYR